jgi:LuxR family maltose regulon positive regulatory protein
LNTRLPARVPQLAKLSLPRLPPVAARERLIRRLDDFADLPCIWVCGPAGSGKTTLVADYLRRRERASFWYHVDEGDRDPASTISYLVALARGIDPAADALPYLLPEHRADIPAFCRQFFRQFFPLLPAECTIVFDNCHETSTDSFHTILRTAVDEAPAGITVIALSRHQLPVEFIKLEANREAGVLGAADLELDLTEARAVASSLTTVPDADIASIHSLAGGWVAGLVLVLARTRAAGADETARQLDLSSREAVFGYFADELFASAEPPLQTLLLHTAILPTVTPAQACELTGDSRAGDLLEGLYRRHFFTMRHEPAPGSHEASFRYHDLFRAFLLERLERDLPAAELAALRPKVAAILERTGLLTRAIEQYHVLGKTDDVARLVLAGAQTMIDQGRLPQLQEWLSLLPAASLAADPWLLLYDAHVSSTTAPAEAIAAAEAAYNRFRELGDEDGQLSAVFALMETILVGGASYRPWDRWIDVLAGLLASRPPTDPAQAVRGWHTLLYTCLYRRPGHPMIATAVRALERELLAGNLHPTQAIQAATGLIAYAHFCCDEALAARVISVMEHWLAGEQLAVMSRALAIGWLAVWYFFDARHDKALHFAESAHALAIRHGFAAQAGIHAWYRLQCLAHLGRHEAAAEGAARLRATDGAALEAPPESYAATCDALIHFCSGDTAKAIEVGERGRTAWRANGFIMAGLAWAQSMQAVYRMANGELDVAETLIADSEAGLAGTVCNYPDALYAGLRAHAALTRGDEAGAVTHLKDCFAKGFSHKRIAVLYWARPFLPALFSLAWKEDIERARVVALVDEWRIAPPSPDELHWPHSLEICLLGGFELRRLGQPLDFGRKAPKKLLALLKAIALGGARGLSVESARNLFWADQEGDAAVAAQAAALYRLRKILELPEAIRLAEGRLSLDPALVWVDVTAFERLAQSPDPRDHVRALDLYRGPLLPHDDDQPWSAGERLQLRDTFLRLVERVAQPLEASDTDAAERLYLRGIDAEPLAERLYQGLMRCHALRGRKAEVAAVFRRLRQTLSVVLGIAPSEESERLRRQIVEGA